MSIFKKYKLWWLAVAWPFGFMCLNLIAVVLTGMCLITPTSPEQAALQAVTFIALGLVTVLGAIDDDHLKG